MPAVVPGSELLHGRQVSLLGRVPRGTEEEIGLWDMLLTGFKFMWRHYCGTARH